jgi:hypothetical protein
MPSCVYMHTLPILLFKQAKVCTILSLFVSSKYLSLDVLPKLFFSIQALILYDLSFKTPQKSKGR